MREFSSRSLRSFSPVVGARLGVFLGALGLVACSSTGTPSSDPGTGGASGAGGRVVATGGAGLGGTAGTAGGTGATGGATTAATVTISLSSLKPVPATFRGQNYWSWVVAWGEQVKGLESLVTPLKLGVLRVGGAENDSSADEAYSLAVIDNAVAYARAVGSEPLIQIPVIKDVNGNTPATAASAASLVTYLNVTKKYGIKYVSIGNEPDLYTAAQAPVASFDATKLCAQFKDFATAIKAVDPSISIVGPDLSWKYISGNDWLSPFLDGCASVVDVVAVHRYPLAPTVTTDTAAYADAAKFRSTLASLRSLMKAHGAADKPLAITEANITYDGDPSNTPLAASPGTLPAALWVADQIGIGMDQQLWSLDFWSLSEGWTLGFIDSAGLPRPAYHALALFGDHAGDQVASATGAPSDVAVYASRRTNATKTFVIIVNHGAKDVALTLAVMGGAAQPPTVTAARTSLLAVEIGDDGTVQSWRYGMAEATAGKGPTAVTP